MKKTSACFGWLLIIAVFAASLPSCKSGPKDPKALAQADSLRGELFRADSMLRALGKEKPEEASEAIMNNTRIATAAINTLQDTIDVETATFMTRYRSIAKVLEAYVENYDKMKAALDSLTVNCNNLSHDLQHNTLADGLDPAKSVEHEREQAEEVIGQVRFLVPAVINGLKQNDTLEPKVKAYIDQVNQKIAVKAAKQQGK